MDEKLLAALTDFFYTLDVYLMANWDEVVRRRLRQKARTIYTLLEAEQQRHAEETPDAP